MNPFHSIDIKGHPVAYAGLFGMDLWKEKTKKIESNNREDHFSEYSLWPSDSNIYSRAYRNDNMLGSHCDLLQQCSGTKNGIGAGNVYWFFDGIQMKNDTQDL
jgi:hypothetical protein